MTTLIAGVLLGAAVAILTLPWSRRDPDDFSHSELGYAWRGPRGAVAGALRTLVEVGAAKRSRKRGMARTGARLSPHIDPLARAVYGGLGSSGGVRTLRDLKNVRAKLPAVRAAVVGARLRTGITRRLAGTLAALASVVVALVGVVDGADLAIPALVVTALVGGWLLTLRGATVRGARTLASVPRPPTSRDTTEPASTSFGGGLFIGISGYAGETPGGGFGLTDFGGGHHGGFDGGGFHGGGDSGGGDGNY